MFAAFFVFCWTVLAAGPAVASGPNPDGKALYFRYCASCHGPEGRGDGPDAVIFSEPPRNLREGVLMRYSDSDLVPRVRIGQPLWLGLDAEKLRQRTAEVDALTNQLERLPTVDWNAALRGWDVYSERCASCHGSYGKPSDAPPSGVRGPRDLASAEFQDDSTDAGLEEAVRHGRHHMPALTPRVGDADARALKAFVRLLSPGFESYSRYCAGCHGVDGRGVRGTLGELTELPTTVFDARYFEDHRPPQIREKIWHMLDAKKPAMPHYRSALTDSDAAAIVHYLRGLDASPGPRE